MIDHYSTLGVGKNANADDIKKAYRKLAGKHHPDKGGDTATFQKIEEAYRILSDPNQRQQYDNPMPQGNPFGFPGGGGGFNFNFNSDINDLFGQMFQQHNARRPNTPHAFRTQVHITLEQAYYGDSQNLQLRTPHGNHAITIEIPTGVNHGSQIRYENVIPQATLIVEFIIQQTTYLFCTSPCS